MPVVVRDLAEAKRVPRMQGSGGDGAPPPAALAGEGGAPGRRVQVVVWDPIILEELQALPLVYQRPPMLWVPHLLRGRVCAVWCGLLTGAVQSQEDECANILLSQWPDLAARTI